MLLQRTFLSYRHIYTIAELTELHELTLIGSLSGVI